MITGAGGFIGSRLSSYFRSSQFSSSLPSPSFVFDIIRIKGEDKEQEVKNGNKEVVETGDKTSHKIVNLDLSNHGAVGRAVADIRPDIVIHTAAVTSQTSGAIEADYTAQNLDNSRALLRALMDVASDDYSPALIFSSTVGVYGDPIHKNGVVKEGDILNPTSPYAQSKMDFETVLKSQNTVRYAILRYANIPGKDAFMNYVLAHKKVTFYGDDPYVRDYIHLHDLCDLHGFVVRHLIDGGESLTLNAGSGVGFSFPDMVDEIERQANMPIERCVRPRQENDVLALICDMQRARDVLNWSPNYVTTKDIVTYALHQNNELGS